MWSQPLFVKTHTRHTQSIIAVHVDICRRWSRVYLASHIKATLELPVVLARDFRLLCEAPSHYLNQCGILSSIGPLRKLLIKFNQGRSVSTIMNSFEYGICRNVGYFYSLLCADKLLLPCMSITNIRSHQIARHDTISLNYVTNTLLTHHW